MNSTTEPANKIERLNEIIKEQAEMIRQRDSEIQLYRNKWVTKTSQLRDEEELAVRNMELKVGLQHVQSQEDGYREATTKNRTLNNVLCLTIYYYKWKLTNVEQKLTLELKKSNNERKFLINEFLSLKRLLISNNKLESDMCETAESNGLSLIKSLNGNYNKLSNALNNISNSNQSNVNEEVIDVSQEHDTSNRKSLVPFRCI